MFTKPLIQQFKEIPTPFYYYDLDVLTRTLKTLKEQANKYNYHVHFALKANANIKLLKIIHDYGVGADCVSGNEVIRARESGFNSQEIVFAGVGKTDREIDLALDYGIYCFNCESQQEIEVINELAAEKNMVANIAIRINPNVDANTHHKITTGLDENKFGISIPKLDEVVNKTMNLKHVHLIGIHFHIGSQILKLDVFKQLCLKVNELQKWFEDKGIELSDINVGGGYGVDYEKPDMNQIPDFAAYFKVFYDNLALRPRQKVHFELGRAIIAQCASLITKVLYIKRGVNTNFAIVDSGMSELLRPALYQARHSIQNLTSTASETEKYDVVGPVCESSDVFGKDYELPITQRGDLFAVRTTGAYGETMASTYNLHDLVKPYYSNEIKVLI